MSAISKPVLEIDLEAVKSNYRSMRSLVGHRTQVAAVVKSDAYGLGAVEVSRALDEDGCPSFFVADPDEALGLRAAGIDKPIVVFNADLATSRDICRTARLIAAVKSRGDLESIGRDAKPIDYVLKIDTGFSRFGLDHAELLSIKHLGVFDTLPPCCLFSHLACADTAQDLTNDQQRKRFIAASRLFPKVRRSLSASAGVWLGRSYHFDTVRVGSALYGLNNARVFPNPLRPVVRLRAPLLDVRKVPSGRGVGYGATFRTCRETCLGVLGIGYVHGLPWTCANRVDVRIGAFRAPVVGRISMEYTTVDLTDVPETARLRSELVEILNEGFGIDDLAAAAGVSSQEVLVHLGGSCRRVYSSGPETTASVANSNAFWRQTPSRSSKVA